MVSEKRRSSNGQALAGGVLCIFGVLLTVFGTIGLLVFFVCMAMGDAMSGYPAVTYAIGGAVVLLLALGSVLYGLGMLLAGELGASRAGAAHIMLNLALIIGSSTGVLSSFAGVVELARGEPGWGGGLLLGGLCVLIFSPKIARALVRRVFAEFTHLW